MTNDIKEKIEESSITATPKQVATFLDYVEQLRSDNPDPMGKIMKRNGYTEASSRTPNHALLSRDGWKELMALLPEIDIVANLCRIATGNKNDEGKVPTDRDQITASKTLLKLGNRFPDKKTKVTLNQKRRKIMDITNED